MFREPWGFAFLHRPKERRAYRRLPKNQGSGSWKEHKPAEEHKAEKKEAKEHKEEKKEETPKAEKEHKAEKKEARKE